MMKIIMTYGWNIPSQLKESANTGEHVSLATADCEFFRRSKSISWELLIGSLWSNEDHHGKYFGGKRQWKHNWWDLSPSNGLAFLQFGRFLIWERNLPTWYILTRINSSWWSDTVNCPLRSRARKYTSENDYSILLC